MADESFTDGTRVPSNGNNPCQKTEGVGLISSLPDSILQHILSFIPTKLAIRTSLLSKRWRHVWCDIPSISLDDRTLKAASIISLDDQTLKAASITLNRYTSLKMMNFHLNTTRKQNIPHINRWVEFAISRNVENLSLDFWHPGSSYNFQIPDFFYVNSSVKKLTITLSFTDLMVPACSLSWTSLKKLYLCNCNISDESMAKILSGSPLLESLTLYFCDQLRVLDLSKSLRLRTLKINRNIWVLGPTHIVAPHIHRLRLTNSQLPCTFVNLSSLAEARLDICIVPITGIFEADFLQDMVLKMLEKLQNVEKLTFEGNFLQIISLAEVRGVPFPMFKVKDLTLETVIFQYVIPGIERLLQNSPDLKKLTIRARDTNTIREKDINNYLQLQGLNPDQCWRSKDGVFFNNLPWYLESKHATSFVELVLKNTKTLDIDKIVILLNERYLRFKFEELAIPTLSHNNFSIALLKMPMTSNDDDW
ncbi:putative F-box/LRR-repeat protein At3g18150 [Arabidopsis lyrata subsp. lyrata]|nr:putative F-box/LRR-repeat protein At3g18150 [Arabidopsis lyrata subsp. lyrata]|eukprot:XP_002880923.2 putative F-box/LRR-repeat protein At3g18150 [Arabidopsis lyrata subsp. lyrata]